MSEIAMPASDERMGPQDQPSLAGLSMDEIRELVSAVGTLKSTATASENSGDAEPAASASQDSDQHAEAAHNEAEDVEMVREAMAIVRELIAREATDGEITETYHLQTLMVILNELGWALWEEEWDVDWADAGLSTAEERAPFIERAEARKKNKTMCSDEEATATASEETGGEDMAMTDEMRTEIAETVRAAITPVMAEMGTAIAASIREALAASAPPAPEAPPAAPTAAASATTEAAFPPAEDEEEEDEEDMDKSDAAAEASQEPAVAEVTTEVAEANEDGDGPIVLDGGEDEAAEDDVALARQAMQEFGRAGGSTYRMRGKEGREQYLRDVFGPQYAEKVATASAKGKNGRIPVGVSATQGGGSNSNSAEAIEQELLSIFKR